MNVLLDDMISAEPREVVPGAHLVFHFGLHLVARSSRLPETSLIPVHAERLHVADLTRLDLVDRFDVRLLVMTLQATPTILVDRNLDRWTPRAGPSTAKLYERAAGCAASKWTGRKRESQANEIDAAVDHS
jgi:hypothetical protein